ncbi:MAG: hypothetical protein DHS20C18_52870 [Saprospiraceae bacterium]|nr:MAG: hypothetical protein DHS20C18_52870 [Saprospiraceae bacterium]
MTKETMIGPIDMEAMLQPETDLERKMLKEEDFFKGLMWGTPRYGHPEGEIYKHILEVFDNIEQLDISKPMRRKMRLITLAHDTFKYLEDKSTPRDWSKHHGIYARRFMEKHVDEPTLLEIIELHDEAYYAWRLDSLYHEPEASKQKLNNLLKRVGEQLQLFYLFFKCDTKTGDKIQAPVKWFEQRVKGIDIVKL